MFALDRDGHKIYVGDKVEKVRGGEHSGIEEGDFCIVAKIVIKNRESNNICLNEANRKDAEFDPKNFLKVHSKKKGHLPTWW